MSSSAPSAYSPARVPRSAAAATRYSPPAVALGRAEAYKEAFTMEWRMKAAAAAVSGELGASTS
eukprot:5597470-Pyramimonas_sp.AAC.1